ncbi:PEP-CTERM sorting domain-containing protein [Aquabacterium sp. A7-Y]|uniref:PEP-CTERM sorting domain-containing protein n=1 Tax=Aquabacterium sp. A7-Y TaxID=1349605 RepID=UPI00223D65B8|nr:PEP-CTERM sorting domain-containing protein [Aquabacterium sp. A7-Y]MCW7538054.1 PEP-CTERM sorting domain-containing protein [Aquabacterium sp. A7-Y]
MLTIARRPCLPLLAALGALTLACATAAQAVPLSPGDFVSPLPGTTVAAEPQLAGTVVEDVMRSVSGTFAQSGQSFSLEIQDRVVLADDGTYDFYYRVTVLDKPTGYPVTLRRDGLAGFATNAGWRIDGLGDEGVQSATRSVDGNAVQFDFGFELNEGESSRFFFVDTDATAYAESGTGTVDLTPSHLETGVDSFTTFAPVPEPSTAALGLLGLAALGLAGCRRQR